jgi:hypothetical protein
MAGYAVWLDTFNRTGDPIAAGNASIQAQR